MRLITADSSEPEPARGLRFAPSVVLVSVTSSPSTDASPSEASAEAPTRPASRGPAKSRTRTYLAVGVAIILVVVAIAAYSMTVGFRPAGSSGTSGTVLITDGTGYPMSVGQYNGISFTISQDSRITGTLNSSHGVQIYILTPSEFQYLVKNNNVSSYVWTSGVVANAELYVLNVTVQPGQWVLSFVNPNLYVPTGVGFYSNVVLAPA